MNDWLSATWEASWKSFQYFNLYRLVAAAALVGMAVLAPGSGGALFHLADPELVDLIGILYVLVTGCGVFLATRWQHHFNAQLSCQVITDVVAATLFMYASDGLASGIGIMLFVSLAAASLVGRGRLVLFYAATATLSVLFMQIYGVLAGKFEMAGIVHAGLFSTGFFATAVLARLLGQRLMINEDLARRRGIALENQMRISQRVIERMQDGVLVLAAAGKVLRHNPVAEDLLGVPLVAGAGLERLSPPLAAAFAAWQGESDGDPAEVQEFAGPSGKRLRARFEPTDSSAGEVLLFLEDAGRIQERAQQLKLAALGRLTASIAHEIRNPLAAIGHAGDLLREERRDETQGRLLRIIGDNVARLDRIVKDVLELGRSDRAQPEVLRLDIAVVEFVQEFVREEGCDPAIVRVEAEAPLEICFDRAHLLQVLWNLTANALRHSSRQAGAVLLRAAAGPLPGRVELHVIDDGPGVPAAIGSQVFEPFFTTRHQGTGLGLFIARELCETSGARLELAPAAGCGHFIVSGRSAKCSTHVPKDALAVS